MSQKKGNRIVNKTQRRKSWWGLIFSYLMGLLCLVLGAYFLIGPVGLNEQQANRKKMRQYKKLEQQLSQNVFGQLDSVNYKLLVLEKQFESLRSQRYVERRYRKLKRKFQEIDKEINAMVINNKELMPSIKIEDLKQRYYNILDDKIELLNLLAQVKLYEKTIKEMKEGKKDMETQLQQLQMDLQNQKSAATAPQ